MNAGMMKGIFFGVLGGSLLLVGCGGGGGGGGTDSGLTYSGSSDPVAIDISNAENLSIAAAVGAAEGVGANNADNASPFGISISGGGTVSPNVLAEQVMKIGQIVQNEAVGSSIPVGLTLAYSQLNDPDLCGGTVTVPNNFDPNGLLNVTMTFTNLCFDDGSDPLMPVVLNGSVVFAQTSSNITIEFRNLNILNNAGETVTVNSSVACNTVGTVTCTAFALYEGGDGRVYKIEDYTVSGDNSVGYQIQAVFYHPIYGRFDITTPVALKFNNCTNGNPSFGTINLSGASGSSATITFIDCDTYSGTWNDGVSSDVFSGSWL